MKSYIEIREVPLTTPLSRKTKVWVVLSERDGALLGRIGWMGKWRRYSFWPAPGTIFDEVCMRELSDFIERQTKEHKAKVKTK